MDQFRIKQGQPFRIMTDDSHNRYDKDVILVHVDSNPFTEKVRKSLICIICLENGQGYGSPEWVENYDQDAEYLDEDLYNMFPEIAGLDDDGENEYFFANI